MKVTKPQTYKTPNLDKLFEYISDQVAYETAKENICNYISDAVIRSKELTNSYVSIYDITEAILLDTAAFINDHGYNKINGISLKDIVESLYNAMDEKDDNSTAIKDSSDDSEYYKKLFGTMVQKLHYDDKKDDATKNHDNKSERSTIHNKNSVSGDFFNQVMANFWDMNTPKMDSDVKKDTTSKNHDGKNDDAAKHNKNVSANDPYDDFFNLAMKIF